MPSTVTKMPAQLQQAAFLVSVVKWPHQQAVVSCFLAWFCTATQIRAANLSGQCHLNRELHYKTTDFVFREGHKVSGSMTRQNVGTHVFSYHVLASSTLLVRPSCVSALCTLIVCRALPCCITLRPSSLAASRTTPLVNLMPRGANRTVWACVCVLRSGCLHPPLLCERSLTFSTSCWDSCPSHLAVSPLVRCALNAKHSYQLP